MRKQYKEELTYSAQIRIEANFEPIDCATFARSFAFEHC